VDHLAAYYGLVPLSFVLLVLYISLWLAYRFSHRAISPVTWLANQVNMLDFNAADFSAVKSENLPYNAHDDIQVLSDAIVHLGERLEAFISRERNFTRDASHELRSPLTVINIAADMLLSEQELATPVKNSVLRIKRATLDMEELISAFLLLARESDQVLSSETVCLNDILEEAIEHAKVFIQSKPLRINYKATHRVHLRASDKVLSILFGNIIRNAILYTDEGSVDISLTKNCVVIQDSGSGIPEQQVKEIFKPYYRGKSDHRGHGVGLTIVKRLSDRFNWPIIIESKVGMGTNIQIQFPEAWSSS
ncbi:MAG: HAMP domain-containing sensor histidine kinase, partial [Gammaproteobacteria bacterium]